MKNATRVRPIVLIYAALAIPSTPAFGYSEASGQSYVQEARAARQVAAKDPSEEAAAIPAPSADSAEAPAARKNFSDPSRFLVRDK